jgi:hypothetical protein
VWVVLGTALLIGGGSLWWRAAAKRQAVAAPEPVIVQPSASVAQESNAPATSVSSEQKKDVMLRVTAFPLSAEIRLDGKPLSGNPYLGPVPLDDNEHQIEARADGHETQSTTVKFERDVDVVVTLEKEKSTAPRRRYIPRRAPAPAPKPAPQNKPASADCDPPFYLDSRGVKKYKPGCL